MGHWSMYDMSLRVPTQHTVKKGLGIFPSPARMSLTKLSLAGNNLPSGVPGMFGKKINEFRKFFSVQRRSLSNLYCRHG